MMLLASREKEFICRKCGYVISIRHKAGLFCPKCGTILREKPKEKYWLFQFNPKIYRWHERIKETHSPERWLVSRYWKKISKGDAVILWSSGLEAGVCGFGKVITDPEIVELSVDEIKFWIDKSIIDKFKQKKSVLVEYLKVLDKPLSEEQCHSDPELCGLGVFLNPQGTNFRLKPVEWDRIVDLTCNL